MWSLNEDDLKNAKAKLEARRSKLRAEYEKESKYIDAELVDIEMVQLVAVHFLSNHDGNNAAPKFRAAPEQTAEKEPSLSDASEFG